MKYAFIRKHAGRFRVTVMARALEVSGSAYYRWLRGGERGPRAKARAKLDSLREAVRQEMFEYTETFYITVPLHSPLGYLSPAQFEMTPVA